VPPPYFLWNPPGVTGDFGRAVLLALSWCSRLLWVEIARHRIPPRGSDAPALQQ